MAWRVAESLEVLRRQIDALAPNRSKAADGAIGDAAHASRGSDHNPWVKDGAMGIVTARDFTHDPADGMDAGKMARALADTRDARIKYIISNGQIVSSETSPWVWRRYTGANPHDHHFHISVQEQKPLYDSTELWDLSGYDGKPDKTIPKPVARPTLRRGSKGEHVRYLQSKIVTSVDGEFGPKTERALKDFQKSKGLVADGICGFYSWRALG